MVREEIKKGTVNKSGPLGRPSFGVKINTEFFKRCGIDQGNEIIGSLYRGRLQSFHFVSNIEFRAVPCAPGIRKIKNRVEVYGEGGFTDDVEFKYVKLLMVSSAYGVPPVTFPYPLFVVESSY